jgi:hypothetical protein
MPCLLIIAAAELIFNTVNFEGDVVTFIATSIFKKERAKSSNSVFSLDFSLTGRKEGTQDLTDIEAPMVSSCPIGPCILRVVQCIGKCFGDNVMYVRW